MNKNLLLIIGCLLVSLLGKLFAQCPVTISTTDNSTRITCNHNGTLTLTAGVTAQGPISYLWQKNGADFSTAKNITIQQEGAYTVKITTGANCTASASVLITMDTLKPEVSILAFPETICAGESATLVALGAVSYVWDPPSSQVNQATNVVNPQVNTTYSVTGTAANGCKSGSTKQIVVNALPAGNIAGSTALCTNDASPAVTFTATAGKAPFTFDYTVNNGDIQAISTAANNPSVSLLAPTANTGIFQYNLLYVTDDNGCRSPILDSARITIRPKPQLTSARIAHVCDSFPFFYTAESSVGGTLFIWERLNNPNISPAPSPPVTAETISEVLYHQKPETEKVPYVFTLSTGRGCETRDTLVLLVHPTPVINPVPDQSFCNSEFVAGGIPFESSTPLTLMTWINTNPEIGIPATGNGNIPPFTAINPGSSPISATITVSIQTVNCGGSNLSFNITVLPAPVLESAKTASICNLTEFNYKAETSPASAGFSWQRLGNEMIKPVPGPESGSNPIKETLENLSPIPQTVRYATKIFRRAGCETHDTLILTVNPTPILSAIPDTTVCNIEFVKEGIKFFSSTPNAGFTWTNDNITIGLPAGGEGFIPPFIAENKTTQPVTANIRVKPTYGPDNCPGPDSTFQINVRPGPAFSGRRDTLVCDNDIFTYTAASPAEGTAFQWTRVLPANGGVISSMPGTGSGAVVSDRLDNVSPTGQPLAVYYVYTLSTGNGTGCQNKDSVKFTVLPTASIKQQNDTIFCNGTFVKQGITFASASPDVAYTWTNSNVRIGLPAGGTGPILPFNATNESGVADSAKITVTVTSGPQQCKGGDPMEFWIKVLPKPYLTSTKDTGICSNGLPFVYHAKSSTDAAISQITWTRPGDMYNNPGNGNNPIQEILANDSTQPLPVRYYFKLSIGSGCDTEDSILVRVNPVPKTNALANLVFCNNELAQPINFSSPTQNVSFTWASDTTIGFGKNGLGNIPAFIASNQGTDTLKANLTVKITTGTNCAGPDASFVIAVLPTPLLNSPVEATVCNDSIFTYTAGSTATGITSFTWNRILPAGGFISSNAPGTGGTNIIDDLLSNTGTQPGLVGYAIRLQTGANCYKDDTLHLLVNPSPQIIGTKDTAYCHGTKVNGIPFSSLSPDSSFSWTCIPSIGFGTYGSGSIPAFTASNSGDAPVEALVTVSVTTGLNACKGRDTSFTITVNPSPPEPLFTSLSAVPNSETLQLCNGSENINFNINSPAPGITYNWTSGSPNSTDLSIRDRNDPNTVVSFFGARNYTIRAIAIQSPANGGCRDTVNQRVVVNTSSDSIQERRIFLKQPGNVLVYPDNTLDQYQWGYSEILSTSPDSSFAGPVPLPNQVYQFFVPESRFIANGSLDTTRYIYWIQVKKGDCQSRVYYNGPYKSRAGITVAADPRLILTVFPNPNRGIFDLSITGNMYGAIRANIYNAMGRLVFTKNFIKTTPEAIEKFVTASLADGVYYIVVNSSDLKQAETRFIIHK